MPKKDTTRWIDLRFNEEMEKFIRRKKSEEEKATYTRQVLFFIPGTAATGTNVSAQAMWRGNDGKTIRIDALCETAPVGSALTHTVKADGTAVGTVSISAGGTTGTTSAMSLDKVDDGDPITVDCDAVGSSTAGADVTIILECEVEVDT